jgi:hypothetical protein
MKPKSLFQLIFLTIFVITTTLVLFFFSSGMIRIGQQNDRFTSEPTALATVKTDSGLYQQQKTGWETDLSFTTASGQVIRLPEEWISSDEKAVLETGGSIQRLYLQADPHIIRPPSHIIRPPSRPTQGGQSEYWLAALFAVIGIFNLGYLGHVWRQQIKFRRNGQVG